MKYDIRHITTYRYEAPVATARCTLRLTPRNDRGQRVHDAGIEIAPAPAHRIERTDFFGNRVTVTTIDQAHADLRIVALANIEVNREAPPEALSTLPWTEVRELALDSESLDCDSPVHFLHRSRLVPIVADVTEYARESFSDDRPILDAANELMDRIYADFKYDPAATVISTPLAEAFERRGGVCQDFAHIMIAGLRGLGLPAAYVSGYIRTIPPEGQPRLAGADASHAWVSVWCGPDAGWCDLDPTNDVPASNDHIVLAIGRDYADVSPIDGVIVGSGGQNLQVRVDVIPHEEKVKSSGKS